MVSNKGKSNKGRSLKKDGELSSTEQERSVSEEFCGDKEIEKSPEDAVEVQPRCLTWV